MDKEHPSRDSMSEAFASWRQREQTTGTQFLAWALEPTEDTGVDPKASRFPWDLTLERLVL